MRDRMTRVWPLAAVLVTLWGGTAYAANAAVTIQGATFTPASVTINAGESVTWTNLDGIPHSAKAEGGAFDTGVFSTGSRTATIANPGTYGYFCAVHPVMRGTVNVVGQATPQPTPAPTSPPTPAPTPAPAPTAAPTLAPVPVRATPAPATPSPSPTPTASPTPAPTATAAPSAVAQASPTPVPTATEPSPPPAGRGDGPAVAALVAIGAGLGVTSLAVYLARKRG